MYCSNCGIKLTRENTKLEAELSFLEKIPLIEVCVSCGYKIRDVGKIERKK